MKTTISIIVSCMLLFMACKGELKKDNAEKWKKEIVATEHDFALMAASNGIRAAFTEYSAPDVVILRNDSLIRGKSGLEEYYEKRESGKDKISLSWEPDFADVSSSGDLGYTFGKYVYTITDSTGKSKSFRGIFHTVWKRQPDGAWKFVWD